MTKKATRKKTRADRELALLLELQQEYGWAFSEMPRKNERDSVMFSRRADVGGRTRTSLVVARRAVVVVPSTSVLAVALSRRSADARQARAARGSLDRGVGRPA